MAGKGHPPTQFKKGVSGNPNGRPKGDPALRTFIRTTNKEFVEKLQQFGCMKKSELKVIVEDEDTQVFDAIFAGVLYDAAERKDKARDTVFDRLFGKPKDVEVEAPFGAEQEIMRRIPMNELIELARKYQDKK